LVPPSDLRGLRDVWEVKLDSGEGDVTQKLLDRR
jgi:hypothetical protein